jgi:hypothetical protein
LTANEIGEWCLQQIQHCDSEVITFLGDRALPLCPLLNRNLRAIPMERVLEIVTPQASEIGGFEAVDAVVWETFICRVVCGSPQEIVMQGCRMIRAVINELEDVPDLLRSVIFMEVVLTELAAGIVKRDDIQRMVRELPMTAVSNYHRRLAINVLSHRGSVDEEIGAFLQGLLNEPVNEEVLQAFIQLPGAWKFDEENWPSQGEIPPGFVFYDIDYAE